MFIRVLSWLNISHNGAKNWSYKEHKAHNEEVIFAVVFVAVVVKFLSQRRKDAKENAAEAQRYKFSVLEAQRLPVLRPGKIFHWCYSCHSWLKTKNPDKSGLLLSSDQGT